MLLRPTSNMERNVQNRTASAVSGSQVVTIDAGRGTTSWILGSVLKGFYLVVGIALIIGLAYLLGRPLLVEKIGNDGPHQLSYAVWLARYFPNIPNWFPIAGGGYSVGRAYPLLPELLIAAASSWTSMSPLEWFHISSFASIVLTAIGIFAFCWSALKNWTLGLIAACLYLISPISWFFIWQHGFITTVMALALMPFALLAFDRYLSGLIKNNNIRGHRVWFFLSVILLGVTVLMHVYAGAATAAAMLMYALLSAVSQDSHLRVGALWKATQALLAIGVATGLFLMFWLVPLYSYSRLQGSSSYTTADVNVILEGTQSLDEMIGLTPPEVQHWERNASFPIGVFGLSLLGVILSWAISRKWFPAGTIGVLMLIVAATASIQAVFAYLGPLSTAFNLRSSLLIATVFLPIGAAIGCWDIAKLAVYPFELLSRAVLSKAKRVNRGLASLSAGMVSIIALIVAVGVAFAFRSWSSKDSQHLNYGIDRVEGVNLKDVWRTGQQEGSLQDQLQPESWPTPSIAAEDSGIDESLRVLALLPENKAARVDISPYLGRLAQNMVVYTGDSQLAIYTASADLMSSMHGYYAGVFFGSGSDQAISRSPDVLNELARWLGTEFIYLNTSTDVTDIYDRAGWGIVAQDHLAGVPIEIRQFPESSAIATLSSKPSILVVGNPEIDSYMPVFRLAVQGAIPFENAWIVEGKLPVDKYSLQELQRFDAVFLHGYTYNNRTQAWSLLDQFVRQGGALFVDTGWQWTVPDWEADSAPDVLPVNSLKWTSYESPNDYWLEAPEISGELDPSRFSSLTWNEKPWGVSGVSRAEVREWGQVVLSAAGEPLIVAGEYGEGRIIWSGMNLVSHAYDKANHEEIRLIHELIGWLIDENEVVSYPITAIREHPDRIDFRAILPTATETMLYWREAYYPDWKAYLVQEDGKRQSLPIYEGGPGFMLIAIPARSGELNIVLEWETNLVERLAGFLSVGTVLVLTMMMAEGVILGGRYTSDLRDRFQALLRKDKSTEPIEWADRPRSYWADSDLADTGNSLTVAEAKESMPPTGQKDENL